MALLSADSFNRANDTSSLGSTDGAGSEDPLAWTAHLGTWGINGNEAYTATSNANGAATVDLGTTDVDISVTLGSVIPSGSVVGLVFRRFDNNNCWKFRYAETTQTLTLQRVGSGSGTTTVASVGSTNLGPGDVMRVRVVGIDIRCYVNGDLKFAYLSSAMQNQTRHGIIIESSTTARLDNWSASTVTGAANVPAPVVRGIAAGDDMVLMGPGGGVVRNFDWQNNVAAMVPFRNSRYGIIINPATTSQVAGFVPNSLMWLYRIDDDPGEPTGYKVRVLTSGVIANWNNYYLTGGTYLNGTFGRMFPLNDRQIVLMDEDPLPSDDIQCVRVVTRHPNNTLTITAKQLSNSGNGTGNRGAYHVRIDDTHFARGYRNSSNSKVETISVDASGTCTVDNTSAAGGIPNQHFRCDHYNSQDGFLMGWDGDDLGSLSTDGWAHAYSVGAGYSGTGSRVVLPGAPNIFPADGLLGGAATREMALRRTNAELVIASYDGSSWVTSGPSNSGFPFAAAGQSPQLYNWGQHYGGVWLTFGALNNNSNTFDLQYARTSAAAAVANLDTQASTGITNTDYGYKGVSLSTIIVARHSDTLAVLWGAFNTVIGGGTSFKEPIAFATP